MKLRKILAGAMAVLMAASSLLVGPVETKADEADITTGLVGYYGFEDSLKNEASETGTAKLHGGAGDTWNSPTTGTENYATGKVGQAYSFGGKVGDVNTEGLELDIKLPEVYTISFWANPNSITNYSSMVFIPISLETGINIANNWGGATFPTVRIWGHADAGDAYLDNWLPDPDGDGEKVAAPSDACGAWRYITLTCDAEGKLVLYMNGAKVADGSHVAGAFKGMDMFLGINFWDVTFDGLMDEVSVYERSLSADDVAALYASNGVPVEKIFISDDAQSLVAGDTYELSATTFNPSGEVTWTSSDETIATVDNTGKVTAVKAGEVTITAKVGEETAVCAITVVAKVVPMTGIELTTDKTEIKVGATAQLTTTVAPADTTDDKTVTYTSSDATIATVDANGKVTAVKPGKVTITAKVGTFTDTVEITVPVVPVTSIDLKVDKTDLEKGDIVNVVATVNPADTTEDKTITWTSSDTKVATVDANGTVTAVGGGNATITATIGEVTATVKFNVTAQETVIDKSKIDNLSIGAFLEKQTDGVELKQGHTYTFTFKGTGTDAASKNYYETPCYFVYTNSENKFNVADYKELIFVRGDVWCWFDGDAANKTPDKLPEGTTFTRTFPADWDAWVAANKAGADCKIVVKYDGKTVTATFTVADATTVASFPVTIPSGSKLYLGLTGEKVDITNIEVADEYVKTITGTGDFNMVLPLVLVLFGGAVVLVASKKRFA